MKVLLAVDQSQESTRAVKFVGQVLGNRTTKDAEIILFHVVESLPDYILDRSARAESGGALRQLAEEWEGSNKEAGEKLLAQLRASLESAGVPASCLKAKLVVKDARPEARRIVAAIAIIEEMKQGGYDVVVVGRRGTSRGLETFLGSVAEKITREAHGKTVWVVD